MLKVLPSHISNLIAAGEVVQRPSSVVKELMENAIDAGATSVTVVINDSGKTLIQVIDNGCGMTPQEAALCFERHATSKIEKAEDLYSIESYGFRGEALASIAACADVTLKTRKEGAECGCEIHVAESRIDAQSETACPQGCNFAVRNIFYNIPARRKFLKSDNVEYRQIVSEFTRIALTRTEVEFRLVHNSKDIFHIQKVSNAKQRITQLCGRDMAKDLIDAQTDTSIINIKGFVGKPKYARKNQPNQYLFINGRYFKSPMLHKAIIKAYGNLIPDSHTPSYFLFMEMDPGQMDINIHPSKTEIKFENEPVIFEILHACIKEAIGEGSLAPSIDFDTEGAPEIPVIHTGYRESHPLSAPKIDYDPLFNPFDEEKKTPSAKWNSASEWGGQQTFGQEESDGIIVPSKAFGTADAEAALPDMEPPAGPTYDSRQNGYGFFGESSDCASPLLVLKGKYILTTVKSGIMIIDIARARERILFERYLNAITAESNQTIQEHMFPQTLELDHNSCNVLAEHAGLVRKLGFDIRPFGKDTVVVYGSPATFAQDNLPISECVDTLISDLQETGKDFEQEARERIAWDMVRHSGASGAPMGNMQAQEMIDALFACTQPNITPQGANTMAIISMEELTKKL